MLVNKIKLCCLFYLDIRVLVVLLRYTGSGCSSWIYGFWLFFLDIRVLVAPLVSSSSSCIHSDFTTSRGSPSSAGMIAIHIV